LRAVRVLLDLVGPELDAEPPREPVRPARPYLICSTPRSGSGLLCRALARVPGAGAPLEYFNPLHRGLLTERWRCGPALDGYVRALYAHRTTPEGVFGTKLHWDQLVNVRAEALGIAPVEPGYELAGEFLQRLFGTATYVRIIRRDVDRQAVSLWFALVTGTWSVAAGEAPDDGRAQVPYSYEGIDRCRRLIENADVHWDRLLRGNGIEPVVVVYEELDAEYVGTVARVLAAVAPGAAGAPVAADPPTRRLGDEHTERLLERFMLERQSRGLPDPLGALAS
jgi:LPS sulfotransferase NodH